MVIMPTGKNYYDWSLGKDGKVVKTAGNGKQTTTQGKSDRDPMYEAAEKFMASKKTTKKAQFEFGKDIENTECPACNDKVGEVAEITDVTEVKPEGDFGGKEVTDVAEVADTGTVKEIVKEVSDALGEAKSKLDSVTEDNEEVTIELPEEDVNEIDFEVETDETDKEVAKDIPGIDEDKEEDKEEGELGIPKKSEEDDKTCCNKTEKKQDKKECKEKCEDKKEEKTACAKTIGEFTKMSEISPTTRKKVYTYWAEYLGYPKDFCKLMVTDYEKK